MPEQQGDNDKPSPGTMTDFEYASHEIERLLTALTDRGIQIDL